MRKQLINVVVLTPVMVKQPLVKVVPPLVMVLTTHSGGGSRWWWCKQIIVVEQPVVVVVESPVVVVNTKKCDGGDHTNCVKIANCVVVILKCVLFARIGGGV